MVSSAFGRFVFAVGRSIRADRFADPPLPGFGCSVGSSPCPAPPYPRNSPSPTDAVRRSCVPASNNGARRGSEPVTGPPLLFGPDAASKSVIELGSRRHLFLDAALIATRENLTFTAHPVRVAERVFEGSGWISVVDAGPQDIRLYANGPDNSLAVFVSKDGVYFTAPDLGRGEYRGRKNIVVTDPASVGTVFIDRNGPPDERWKIVSGLRQRGGVFVYTSADGFTWHRHESA